MCSKVVGVVQWIFVISLMEDDEDVEEDAAEENGWVIWRGAFVSGLLEKR